MNKNFVDKLVPAYKGDEPYIFVSYSHQDSSFVFPELTWLRDQGFNVWYDEGIEAGSEWREEIANAIKNARLVLYFVSKRSAQSENCRKEISLADKQQIPIIAIHFEPTELPGSLDLTLSDRQAILRYEISDREYQEKLQPRILSYLGQPIVPLKAITRIKFRYKAVALTVGFLGILSILWSVNESRLWLTEIAYDLVIRGATLISPYALAMEQGIAVLPFANMSNDPDNEYFSDGISEEIINALVKTNSMNVIARTSAFAFKGKNQDIREIGRILGVTHILEGSVRKANNRVRITVQLIDTITGAHLWSETYDRELLDIFAIQYEIATTVVNQIGIELTAGAQPEFRPTGSDVYELYLQATHLVNADNPADLEKAITLFEQAIALDRNHVDSWVGLGMTYGRFTTSYRGHRFPDEVQPMAINAFRTALEIDPANTRAMGMLGWLLAMQEFKWKDGVALMKKSVALNPNDGLVQALYGWLLFHTGQPEAVSVIEKAYRLDPLDPDVIFIKSALLTWLGQPLDAMTLGATLLLHDQEGYRSNVLVALAFAYNRPILAEERLVRARKVAGANEPFIKLLETMIALGRGDTKRFEELRAEVFDLAQHTPLQFLGNIPWTKDQIVDIWNIRVNHRQVDLLVGIFRQKPSLMSEADWNRIKILTRRDEADIGMGVFAALERTADEQEILRSLAKQPSEKHRQMYVGLYKDEQSGRTARLEWNNSELIVHYPESDITRRLIPQGDHQFKRLDSKQTFEFEVVDDQVIQFVRDFDFALLVPDEPQEPQQYRKIE